MYILLIYSDGMQINITLGHINEVDRVAFNFFPAGNLSSQHSCKDVLFRHTAPQNLKLDLLLHFPDEHSQYCVSLLLSCPGELFRDQGDKPSLEGGQVLPDLLLLSQLVRRPASHQRKQDRQHKDQDSHHPALLHPWITVKEGSLHSELVQRWLAHAGSAASHLNPTRGTLVQTPRTVHVATSLAQKNHAGGTVSVSWKRLLSDLVYFYNSRILGTWLEIQLVIQIPSTKYKLYYYFSEKIFTWFFCQSLRKNGKGKQPFQKMFMYLLRSISQICVTYQATQSTESVKTYIAKCISITLEQCS